MYAFYGSSLILLSSLTRYTDSITHNVLTYKIHRWHYT